MVYSTYKQQRIMFHYLQGHKVPTICRLLQEEHLGASRVEIDKFLKKFRETGTIARRPGSGCPSKVTEEIKSLDDETSAVQLHRLLSSSGYSISLRTIRKGAGAESFIVSIADHDSTFAFFFGSIGRQRGGCPRCAGAGTELGYRGAVSYIGREFEYCR